jgi:hypothetical protein
LYAKHFAAWGKSAIFCKTGLHGLPGYRPGCTRRGWRPQGAKAMQRNRLAAHFWLLAGFPLAASRPRGMAARYNCRFDF